jgi:hypothetical protein
MKFPKLELKKKELKLGNIRKASFNPGYYWSVALALSFLIIILGALAGVKFFRQVYSESYKTEDNSSLEAAATLMIEPLEKAVERRVKLLPDLPIPEDPSL